MTDVNSQTSSGQSEGGRDHRGGRQTAAGRPTEARTFASDEAADDKTASRSVPGPDVGLQIQHEAVLAGQEMIRMGEQATAQAAELWRQSLEPLTAWQTEMRRWFDYGWGQMTGVGAMRPLQTARPFAGGAVAALMGAPPADLEEADDAYRLCIEVPGMAAEDLKLEVKDGRLVVCGQKTQERHDGAGACQISERRYGRFERIFALPTGVDRQAIDAKLQSGLLKIKLPKTAPATGDRSQIDVHY